MLQKRTVGVRPRLLRPRGLALESAAVVGDLTNADFRRVIGIKMAKGYRKVDTLETCYKAEAHLAAIYAIGYLARAALYLVGHLVGRTLPESVTAFLTNLIERLTFLAGGLIVGSFHLAIYRSALDASLAQLFNLNLTVSHRLIKGTTPNALPASRHTNPDSAKLCNECAGPVPVRCSNCGTLDAPGSKVWNECFAFPGRGF